MGGDENICLSLFIISLGRSLYIDFFNKYFSILLFILYLLFKLDTKSTKLSRLHNNANVMTLGSRLIKKNVALKCVNTFLKTNFDGDSRHLKRIKKI